MSDIQETVDAIRQNSIVAALEKRLTVDANRELVDLYNQAAKPSYITNNDLDRAWQSDFFTTTRVTASCFLNPFASDTPSKSTLASSATVLQDVEIQPKPLALAFASFNEFTDDVKALFLKPAILTLSGAWHAVLFACKMVEIVAHLAVAALHWINLEVIKNQLDSNANCIPSGSINKASEQLYEDLKNAGEAALDLVASAIKMVVYPFVAGYEIPAQIVSMTARSIFSYRNISKDDVAEVLHDGAGQAKKVVEGVTNNLDHSNHSDGLSVNLSR